MAKVNVTIDGILLFCDESVGQIDLGNGYDIRKIYFDDLPFKSKVVDGRGNITINYLGSRLYDTSEKVYFMCIHKEDTYQVELPDMAEGDSINDKDLMCDRQLVNYMDTEMEYLNRKFSLLHLFKKGNIGLRETFLEHRFTVMGYVNNTMRQTSDNTTKNITNITKFSLTPEEVNKCNKFLFEYGGQVYDLLKSGIDEFIWGLEQVGYGGI